MAEHMRTTFFTVFLALLLASCAEWQSNPSVRPDAESSSSVTILTETGTDLGNEIMPETTESLEVAMTETGRTVSGLLTADGTIGFGDVSEKDLPLMLEFFDYDCPYCREHALATRPWIDREYVQTGKLAIERHFLPQTAWGQRLASAALCAAVLKGFDAFDALILSEFPRNEAALLTLVGRANIERTAYDACMQNAGPLPSTWIFADGETVSRVPAFRIGNESWLGLMEEPALREHLSSILRK